jgi:hypothetical protein
MWKKVVFFKYHHQNFFVKSEKKRRYPSIRETCVTADFQIQQLLIIVLSCLYPYMIYVYSLSYPKRVSMVSAHYVRKKWYELHTLLCQPCFEKPLETQFATRNIVHVTDQKLLRYDCASVEAHNEETKSPVTPVGGPQILSFIVVKIDLIFKFWSKAVINGIWNMEVNIYFLSWTCSNQSSEETYWCFSRKLFSYLKATIFFFFYK